MAGAWNPSSPRTWVAAELVTNAMFNAEVRDRMLWLAGTDGIVVGRSNVVLSTNFSTASNTLVDVTGSALTLATQNTMVLALASGPGHATTTTGSLTISIDGVDQPTLANFNVGGQLNLPWAFIVPLVGISQASHTFKLRAQCNTGGTLSMNFSTVSNGAFTIIDLRR